MTKTATQMVNTAQIKVEGERLIQQARALPCSSAIVLATIDGCGRVMIEDIPGVIHGEGGTKDILIAAVRELEARERQMSMQRVAHNLGVTLPASDE
jgi:hypothetical protein